MSSEVIELASSLDTVPDGWRETTLGVALAKSEGGGTPPRDVEAYWNGDIPWASVKDVVKGEGFAPEETITAAGLANSTSKLIPAGTNIFAARMGVGAVVRYPFPVAINQDLMAFTPSPDLDPGYLFYWLQARKAAFAAVATGTTVKGIRKDVLLSFALSLPPLDEQRRIAEVLRSVDAAIASNRQYLTQVGSVRAALLQQYFHMADWADGKPLPEGWAMPLLDEVATRGSGHTPNKKIETYWNGGIKWVSLQDTKKLDQVYISNTAQQISEDGIRNSSAVLHPDGVVVVSRDATVGRSAITVGPMAVSQHFIAYRCGDALNNHYLYYWLQRMKPVFERVGAGSTIKTIGLHFFKSMRISLPPLKQQSDIANVMLDADKAIMSAADTIQRLTSMKTTVMSDLLSGRVRVPA
jgi:type I restriction enzyme S subunit